MSSTIVTRLPLIIWRTQRALTLFILIALLAASPAISADVPPTGGQQSITSPTQPTSNAVASPPPGNGKKNDLGGFFTVGAIINILFLGGFIYWARKESQKGKQKKTGKQS